MFKRRYLAIFLALFLGFLATDTFAAGDFTAITTAVDFTTTFTALGTVFAALAGVGVFVKGASIVLSKLGIG